MLSEGNVAKGVLSPERLAKLLMVEKIVIPLSLWKRSKMDGFSKTMFISWTDSTSPANTTYPAITTCSAVPMIHSEDGDDEPDLDHFGEFQIY